MADEEIRESICGLWCDGANVHLCLRDESGARRNACVKFDPFMWSASGAECAYASAELLSRPAGGVPPTPLDSLLFFESVADMDKYFKSRDKSLPSDRISCVENQFLTARGLRMFAGMRFSDLRRMQLDMQIADMEQEIAKYKAINEADTKQLRDLRRNPRSVAKIARERYFMKADDEDIFVLSDDEKPKTTNDETVN